MVPTFDPPAWRMQRTNLASRRYLLKHKHFRTRMPTN
jgi:hypothetical protein